MSDLLTSSPDHLSVSAVCNMVNAELCLMCAYPTSRGLTDQSLPHCMCLLSHHATFIHCSKSVWGLSKECVSSENTHIFTSGASFLALSALAYCCASTRGTLRISESLMCLACFFLTSVAAVAKSPRSVINNETCHWQCYSLPYFSGKSMDIFVKVC